jgi:YlmC/YmxH family sporulation protein
MYELRQKEVINLKDGCRYGYVCDIEFCEAKGHIKKLIVPGPAKVFGMFGREEEFFIPWDCIKKIGSDIILVEIDKRKMYRTEDKEEREEKDD